MTNFKYYEIEVNANGFISSYSCSATSIAEAVTKENEHYNDLSCVNIVGVHEISEKRYNALKQAIRIRYSGTWKSFRSECFKLCVIADMAHEWYECNGNESMECALAIKVAEKLNVNIF